MQKPTTPTPAPLTRAVATRSSTAPPMSFAACVEVERHHELAGLVGLGRGLAVVEVGGQRDEALGGEAVARRP